jgi:trans-aconitate 2-methyltransferase
MTTPTWDPGQYERFAAERARPFHDLIARIPAAHPAQVVDLGCGTGTLTAGLLDRWPTATVLGVDSSPDMLARARSLPTRDRLRFDQGDIATWTAPASTLDVIVSNAALQWVPDHVDLLAGWLAALRTGGSLAFQVPTSGGFEPGRIFRELAAEPRWAERLLPVARRPGPRSASPVQPVDTYLDRLAALGASVDAWETTYHHVLAGPDAVLEWSAGTGLRPYLDALQDDEATLAEFRTAVAVRLNDAYPPRAYGTVLPFRRLFVVATMIA